MLVVEFLSSVLFKVSKVLIVFLEGSLRPNVKLLDKVKINKSCNAIPNPDANSLLVFAFTDELSICTEILIEKLITDSIVESKSFDANKH